MACSPIPGAVPPTLADNYGKAKIIFYGTVKKREEKKGGGYRLKLETEKYWKGNGDLDISVTTGPPNTCDGFAETATEKSGCLVFLDGLNKVISGSLQGDASFCLPKGASRLETIVTEFDEKFIKIERIDK